MYNAVILSIPKSGVMPVYTPGVNTQCESYQLRHYPVVLEPDNPEAPGDSATASKEEAAKDTLHQEKTTTEDLHQKEASTKVSPTRGVTNPTPGLPGRPFPRRKPLPGWPFPRRRQPGKVPSPQEKLHDRVKSQFPEEAPWPGKTRGKKMWLSQVEPYCQHDEWPQDGPNCPSV